MTKISYKHKIFIEEYLKDGNTTRAAIAAGYSKKTASQSGLRLLKNVKVKEAINKGQKERIEKIKIDREWITNKFRELVERAESDQEPVTTKDLIKTLELLGKSIGMFGDKPDERPKRDWAAISKRISERIQRSIERCEGRN